MKTNRTIRFDPDMIKRAEFLGIDINEVCREALKQAVVNYQQNDLFKNLDRRINIAKELQVKSKKCNCGVHIKSDKDITRLYNDNTDAMGVFKVKSKRYFAYNCNNCNTTIYQKITE